MDAAPGREIIVLRHGTRDASRSKLYLNYEDYGSPDGPMRIDYYLWVIREPHRDVIVDLGFSARTAAERGRDVVISPLDALRALGIRPEEFDGDIVITHAHWDHTGHIADFPRARFILTSREYAFWDSSASQPHLFRHLADEQDLQALRTAHEQGRVLLVDPPWQLAPGIRLISGAGHTPGLAMVEVDTAAGEVLLASDAVHFDEELARDMPFRHMVDLTSSYDTFRRIRTRQTQTVVAGHEAGVLDRHPRMRGPLSAVACVVGAVEREEMADGA